MFSDKGFFDTNAKLGQHKNCNSNITAIYAKRVFKSTRPDEK